MSDHYLLINQELVLSNKACISVNDLAIQRGYGVFDFLVTVDGQPVFLEEHLARFYQSANAMHLSLPMQKSALVDAIYGLMHQNNLPNSGIRMILTGGNSLDGYSIGTPNLIISQQPFSYQSHSFAKGLKLITHHHQRQLPLIKTIDYLKAIYLQPTIKAANADDVLYHYDGLITECPRANFFIVTNKQEVITANKNILHGVTRKNILQLKGYKISEGPISLEMLSTAKEAFISSSTKNILPIFSIDNQLIGDGQPGPVTQNLYHQLIELKGISFKFKEA
jgi:D-alanine transaminase/branched-chain amino acid aminotransferase